MSILRVKRTPGFTSVPNRTLHDKRLSFRARGVLTFLLAHPDNWEISTSDLSTYAGGEHAEGRDAIRTALKDLRELGYVDQFNETYKDDSGRHLWRTVTLVKDAVPETDSQAPVIAVTEDGFSGPAVPTVSSTSSCTTGSGTEQVEELRSSPFPSRGKRAKRVAPPVDEDPQSAILAEVFGDPSPNPRPEKDTIADPLLQRKKKPLAKTEVDKMVGLFKLLARQVSPGTPGATNDDVLRGNFGEWNREEGVDINLIRSMVETYWSSAFQRSTGTPAWQDFLASRGHLVMEVRNQATAAEREEHRDDDTYWLGK